MSLVSSLMAMATDLAPRKLSSRLPPRGFSRLWEISCWGSFATDTGLGRKTSAFQSRGRSKESFPFPYGSSRCVVTPLLGRQERNEARGKRGKGDTAKQLSPCLLFFESPNLRVSVSHRLPYLLYLGLAAKACFNVSPRSPFRRASRARMSSGGTLPRLTLMPKRWMRNCC